MFYKRFSFTNLAAALNPTDTMNDIADIDMLQRKTN